MGEIKHKTAIQWTHVPGYIGATWNPLLGCALESPGCTFCYAMYDAYRKGFNPKLPRYHGLTRMVNGHPVWNGSTNEAPESTWRKPLGWRKPHAIFVEDMSDLFYEGFTDAQIDRVFAVAATCPQHLFLILTKRAKRMRDYLSQFDLRGRYVCSAVRDQVWPDRRDGNRFLLLQADQTWPLANVWLGVSTEDQRRADERIPHLLATPAAKRFISAEPLLGPIDLRHIAPNGEGGYINSLSSSLGPNLDQVIVGGESGHNARPHDIGWDRAIRDQCKDAGVAYFEKQLGRRPYGGRVKDFLKLVDRHGGDIEEFPQDLRIRQFPMPEENSDAG